MIVDLDQRVRRGGVALYAAVFSNCQGPRSMEVVYFTLTAIACYVVSDLALEAYGGHGRAALREPHSHFFRHHSGPGAGELRTTAQSCRDLIGPGT